MPINRTEYENTIHINYLYSGDQELIMGEVIGAMSDIKHSPMVYLPFYSDLVEVLRILGYMLICGNLKNSVAYEIPDLDVMYFGTPTIVNDKPLFDGWGLSWTKDSERRFVENICHQAEKRKYKKIISGLGSGDISVEERIEDMGGGKVIAYKDFGDFQDWVIERIL
jgi:hypothetical protein